jgi:hypothetical protein
MQSMYNGNNRTKSVGWAADRSGRVTTTEMGPGQPVLLGRYN